MQLCISRSGGFIGWIFFTSSLLLRQQVLRVPFYPQFPLSLQQLLLLCVRLSNLATMARVPLTSLFSSDQIVISGDEEDAGYRELMDSLAKEPTPWKALCEAIRHGDEAMIREESLHVAGAQTLAAKREAIMIGRPDLLKILLERDQYIEESVVAAACEQKDRDCVRLLLDFGWPINNPVYSTASLLRSVQS